MCGLLVHKPDHRPVGGEQPTYNVTLTRPFDKHVEHQKGYSPGVSGVTSTKVGPDSAMGFAIPRAGISIESEADATILDRTPILTV
jgi:hypothetical protein